jgi:hypothetical protein
MESPDRHISEEAPAPMARDETGTREDYEAPSISALGSYVQLTAGGAQSGVDTDTTSFTL